jgi:hypothetical protein
MLPELLNTKGPRKVCAGSFIAFSTARPPTANRLITPTVRPAIWASSNGETSRLVRLRKRRQGTPTFNTRREIETSSKCAPDRAQASPTSATMKTGATTLRSSRITGPPCQPVKPMLRIAHGPSAPAQAPWTTQRVGSSGCQCQCQRQCQRQRQCQCHPVKPSLRLDYGVR